MGLQHAHAFSDVMEAGLLKHVCLTTGRAKFAKFAQDAQMSHEGMHYFTAAVRYSKRSDKSCFLSLQMYRGADRAETAWQSYGE